MSLRLGGGYVWVELRGMMRLGDLSKRLGIDDGELRGRGRGAGFVRMRGWGRLRLLDLVGSWY